MSKPPQEPTPRPGVSAEAGHRVEPPAPEGRAAGPPPALSLRNVFRAIFVDQLSLRREGASLTIALAPAEAPTVPVAPRIRIADTPTLRMQRALSDLLDTRADCRSVMKHLAALEHHLKVQTGPFMSELSISSLEIMIRQLHGLIAPPPSRGVALLLAELLDAVEQKSRLEQAQAGSQAISSFFVDHKLEVKELSPSVLDEFGEA